MKITNDSAISSVTWRQRPSEASEVYVEGTLTLAFGNAGGGTWTTINSDGFTFDSAEEILNLAVIAEELREKHEEATVFG